MVVGLLCLAGCRPAASVPADVEARARHYALQARERFQAGERELAFELATRALVLRLAACGFECVESAQSFRQIGDLRLANRQPAWAAAAYTRALEIAESLEQVDPAWLGGLRGRLKRACRSVPDDVHCAGRAPSAR